MTYDFDWHSLLKKSECKSRDSSQSKSIQLSSIDGWTSDKLPKLVIIWTFDKVKSDRHVCVHTIPVIYGLVLELYKGLADHLLIELNTRVRSRDIEDMASLQNDIHLLSIPAQKI